MIFCRSLLFAILMYTVLLPFALFGWLTYLLPFSWRYLILTTWQRSTVFFAKVVCGIDYQLEGFENIRQLSSAVIISNHQSTWETMAFFQLFPRVCFVLKRELLRIPFFGWSLSALNPIGINRASAKKALEQVIKQGKPMLADGRWVVIFPEGHRMPVGTLGDLKPGGVFLAVQSGQPIVPVIHDAGKYWPRRQFLKTPGTITVRVGQPIETAGKSASEVAKEVNAWMQREYAVLFGG